MVFSAPGWLGARAPGTGRQPLGGAEARRTGDSHATGQSPGRRLRPEQPRAKRAMKGAGWWTRTSPVPHGSIGDPLLMFCVTESQAPGGLRGSDRLARRSQIPVTAPLSDGLRCPFPFVAVSGTSDSEAEAGAGRGPELPTTRTASQWSTCSVRTRQLKRVTKVDTRHAGLHVSRGAGSVTQDI